ncbi:sigma-70 family RNA polymerase sigma factor [Muribaculum intestinale]|jgi:RNA polymerase sigma-70 factor (ECF subfamily)|uniref:sigma-70 family RNA polymerase sigma factor n=1 Tax=Muribaculum intestinale TaxID=1796646 RepID=UPI0025B1872F|nr:sigma-70 family RNA polymerase sigma factor [Muribaculum intestinale]
MRNLQRLSDQELVTAYANGDNEAFDALLLRHKTRLFNYIFQMVRDRDLSDDIFQETFVKAITTIKQGRYNDMGKFSAWLYRIARNLMVDTFRAQRNEGSLSTDDTDYDILNRRELAEDTIEDVMVDLQIEEDLRRLIDELPDVQREVLNLRYYRELSFKEIAELTGVSINTALGRMRYAILNLRRLAKEKSVCLTR